MNASRFNPTAGVLRGSIPEDESQSNASTRLDPQNWAFLAFVLLIPLQNLYTEYVPDWGGGLNFLNLMFATSLMLAWRCGGRLVRGPKVNGRVWLYITVSVLALLVGLTHVSDGAGHVNILKDQLIAVAFVFLAQMSATDSGGVQRLIVASLLPLPYMLKVVADQHAAVSSWHYSHDLRIAGTFADLGANEFAAYCATAMLVALGLLLGARVSAGWRIFFAGAAICAGIGVVLTYSRTAYVAVLCGVVLLILMRRGGVRLLLPAALALMLMPMVLPPSVVERFGTISVEEGERDESTEDRFLFWEIAREKFSQQPLLGTGFHTFHHAEVNPRQTDTHNFFLREFTEKGLVGGLVLLAMLFSIGQLLYYAVRSASVGSWSYGLSLGMSGAFLALLVGNAFGDRFTHYPMIAHFWLYLGLVLRSLTLDRESAPEPDHARA